MGQVKGNKWDNDLHFQAIAWNCYELKTWKRKVREQGSRILRIALEESYCMEVVAFGVGK